MVTDDSIYNIDTWIVRERKKKEEKENTLQWTNNRKTAIK